MSEEGGLQSKSILIATINRDEARKIFAQQLGPLWNGIDTLPIYMKALFAVFAARISGERDEPHNLLMQIATSTASGKLNFQGVEKLLKKYCNHKIVKRVTNSHAYVLNRYGYDAVRSKTRRCRGVQLIFCGLKLLTVDYGICSIR